MTVVMSSITAVSASASEIGGGTVSTGGGMADIISTAGVTLQNEFTSLVNSLIPVVISIALVGLGMFAIIYLFKVAKKIFAKAAE